MTNPLVSFDGTKIWYNSRGEIHREDGPAIERSCGDRLWYQNNRLHRENGPAVEWPDGSKFWYLDNRLHREDGPAVEDNKGRKEYWYRGKNIICLDNESFIKIIKMKAFW